MRRPKAKGMIGQREARVMTRLIVASWAAEERSRAVVGEKEYHRRDTDAGGDAFPVHGLER